jgi:sugar lactone lactonase YvrE
VVALRTGFAILDFESGDLKSIFDLEPELPYLRFNDGKCDRQGRFWAGTMDEDYPQQRGSLYRLDTNLSCQEIRNTVGISNGLGWSPDNSIFYYTDSTTRTIYAYDFDPQDGCISNERVFAQTPQAYVPDGLTVDADGYIWSAKWDGWKVVRYAPDGRIDLELPIPVQRPTSCTFGGPEMNLLLITSASIDLTAAERETQPLSGNVFVVDTEFRGIPEPKFSG